MGDPPEYVVVGRGRWGERMKEVLAGLGRRATVAEGSPRRHPEHESDEHYEARMAASMQASGASVAWLCVPPGDHVAPLVRGALSSGLHVLAEKPWSCDPAATAELAALARRSGLLVGVHFEYCLLDGVQRWRDTLGDGRGYEFGGRFTTPASDRMGVAADVNLGCHLRAVHRYAVPMAHLAELTCGYETPAARVVWVAARGRSRAEIDFTNQREPIIQRFVSLFEAHLHRGTGADADGFAFGPEFALSTVGTTP